MLGDQGRFQLGGKSPRRLVASDRGIAGGNDHTSKIAQVKTIELSLSGFCPVEPLGDAQLRQHFLRHLDNRSFWHQGPILSGCFGVFLSNPRSHRSHTLQREFCDRALLLWQRREQRGPIRLARSQPVGLRALWQLWRGSERWAASSTVATTVVARSAVAVGTRPTRAITLGTRDTWAIALGTRAAWAISTFTRSAGPVVPVARGALFDDRLERLVGREQGEQWAFLLVFRLHDGEHGDTVDSLFDVGFENITDSGSTRKNRFADDAFGLFRPGCSPGPGAVTE